jgi:TfoX/Sxy family transcriptional regulator of competence genes
MPSKPKNTAANPSVTQYQSLISAIPGLERKGDANPYTAINGNMFTLLHQSSRLAIRLPDDKRAEFMKKHDAALFVTYGAVMKEYVEVPQELLKNTKELERHIGLSYEYAKTLKPKPSRKKP